MFDYFDMILIDPTTQFNSTTEFNSTTGFNSTIRAAGRGANRGGFGASAPKPRIQPMYIDKEKIINEKT